MKGLTALTLDGILIPNLRSTGVISSTNKDSWHPMREGLLVSLMLPMNFWLDICIAFIYIAVISKCVQILSESVHTLCLYHFPKWLFPVLCGLKKKRTGLVVRSLALDSKQPGLELALQLDQPIKDYWSLQLWKGACSTSLIGLAWGLGKRRDGWTDFLLNGYQG